MIQAIIPLISLDSDDHLLTREGERIALQVIDAIFSCSSIDRVTVFSNHRHLVEAGASSGASGIYVPDHGISPLAFPDAYWPWPQFLAGQFGTAAVLVASPRNPYITTEMLDRVIHCLLQNPSMMALVSVVPSSMHPSQLFYGRPTDADTGPLYLPDQDVYVDSLFFPDVPDLWRRNADGTVTNQLTGKKILGRQDFPETVEPDGSFLMLRKAWTQANPSLPPGPMHGFKLAPHESIQLMRRLDYFRYRAMQRARADEKTYHG